MHYTDNILKFLIFSKFREIFKIRIKTKIDLQVNLTVFEPLDDNWTSTFFLVTGFVSLDTVFLIIG